MAQPKAPKGYIPVNVEGDVEVYIYQPTDPRIKSPSWYLYYYYNKKIQRQSLKTKNQKAAHRLARETAEKLSSGQGALLQQVRANRDATFAHLVERTLTEYPKWTDTTKIRIEAQMKIVVGFFGEDRPVQQITTPVVQEFLGWLRAHGGRRHKDRKTGQLAGAGCSNQTYNRYKSYLSTIFKFGIRCGYNTINPVELIEAAPVVIETYEGFHEDQLGLLLTHCPPHTRLIATMLADTGMRHREELGAMTRSWIHFDEAPFPRIVVPGEAAKNRVPRTIPMTKRVQALLHEIMESGLVFDVRTDTNDNGGGKVREYRCPARHRIVPYTSIRKSLSSAGHRAGLGHVRPHDLRHTFVTRMLDLGVPIEQVNYLAGHKSMAMTKRYDHAREEQYGGAIEALDEAGKTGSAEALAVARWNQT